MVAANRKSSSLKESWRGCCDKCSVASRLAAPLAAGWAGQTFLSALTSASLSSLTLISLTTAHTHQGVFQCCPDDFIHMFIRQFHLWMFDNKELWFNACWARLWPKLPLTLLIKCVLAILCVHVSACPQTNQPVTSLGWNICPSRLSLCLSAVGGGSWCDGSDGADSLKSQKRAIIDVVQLCLSITRIREEGN